MPAANPSKLTKTLRQRSKTISGTTCPDTEASTSGGGPPFHANERGAAPKEGHKNDSRNVWERLNLDEDNPQRGRDNIRNERPRAPPRASDGPEPQHRNGVYLTPESFDIELEQERQRLAETKVQIQDEVREHTELLKLLRCRREKVAEQRQKLRRSISPEKRPPTPRSRFTTPDPETPPPSPSPARRACHEAFARMSPLQQHIARDQMHWEGIRPRDTQRERDERRVWEEHQKRSGQPFFLPGTSSPKKHRGKEEQEARDRDRRRRREEMQTEAVRLENMWRDRQRREISEAWEMYESRWASLSSSPPSNIRFHDLPWPVASVFLAMPPRMGATGSLTRLLSVEAVSTFIFSPYHSGDKTRKQKLHDALLRYHPDRFEGRWLDKLPQADGERELVRETVGSVARILGRLLEDES